MMIYGLDVIALLALVAFNFSLSTGFWYQQRHGILEPKDPIACVSQNITFTSTLRDDPVENHSIGFSVKNPSTDGRYVAIDDARVKFISQTTAQFTVNNVTMETTDVTEPYYFYVRSYYWENFASLDNSLMLGTTSVARIFPLVEVKDFACLVYKFTYIICFWNYGDNYGKNMPKVIFKWKLSEYSASWNDCERLNVEEGFCIRRDRHFKVSNLTISIILVHNCGINVTSIFYVDTTKIVKPSPVFKMSATVYSSKCVHVSWETTEWYEVDQEVLVSSKYDTVSINFNSTLGRNRTICILRPYTMYNFTVRVRPTGRYEGYWSAPKNAEVMTYSDVPSASPSIVEGGYWFNRIECEGINLTRHVCVFWTPIKKEEENGPMTSIQGLFRSKGKQRQVDWASNSTYGCSELMCNTTYDVIIQAKNVNGTSKPSSTLKIPNYRRVPKREPKNVQVSRGSEDNNLLVTWDKLSCKFDEPYIAHYDVRYWKQNGENKKSVTVPASGGARVDLIDLESDQTYLVAVRGVTKEGHFGPESQIQRGVPVNKSLTPSEILGIAMVVLVCVLYAGVGIFCVIRLRKKTERAV